MARQLTPLGVVVVSVAKWIVIPLIVALVGFKLIGPNIGGGSTEPANQKQPGKATSSDGKKFQSVRESDH